eukprot:6199837-Karenia_brevis.AAC.1
MHVESYTHTTATDPTPKKGGKCWVGAERHAGVTSMLSNPEERLQEWEVLSRSGETCRNDKHAEQPRREAAGAGTTGHTGVTSVQDNPERQGCTSMPRKQA